MREGEMRKESQSNTTQFIFRFIQFGMFHRFLRKLSVYPLAKNRISCTGKWVTRLWGSRYWSSWNIYTFLYDSWLRIVNSSNDHVSKCNSNIDSSLDFLVHVMVLNQSKIWLWLIPFSLKSFSNYSLRAIDSNSFVSRHDPPPSFSLLWNIV